MTEPAESNTPPEDPERDLRTLLRQLNARSAGNELLDKVLARVRAEAVAELAADPVVTELRELWQAALEREGNLASAVADVIRKATQFGSTEDGDTFAYIVPKGCMHRLVGVARQNGAHIPVAFRNSAELFSEADAIAEAVADARQRALLEAADAIQALHPGEVKNSVLFLRDMAAGSVPVATPTEPAEFRWSKGTTKLEQLMDAAPPLPGEPAEGTIRRLPASPVPAEQPELKGVAGHAPGCDGWRPPMALGFGRTQPYRCEPGCPRAGQRLDAPPTFG